MPFLSPGAVDALLFDLGGVLIEIDFERVFARWARHAGCDAALIRTRFSHDEHYRRHERGEIDAADYFASLRISLGVDLSDVGFEDGWNAVFGDEVPGIAELLRRAGRRLPLYVLTNSNALHQRAWSQRYASLLRPFRRVFVSSELGARKPEPEAFEAVAREMNVAPDRIAFFDDSTENVTGARASGLHAVHVRSLADLEASLSAIMEMP